MAKITIQQKPTFTTDVEIPRIGEKPVKVLFTFAHLDRAQLAEYEEIALNAEKAAGELLKQEDLALVAFNGALEDAQFDQLKKIVKGWGFDDEFNDDNLRALVRSTAQVPRAILNAYRESYQKAREGN